MALAIGMVNSSCALMHLIPDAILQFMGAQGGTVGAFKDVGRNEAAMIAGGGSILKGKGQKKVAHKGTQGSQSS